MTNTYTNGTLTRQKDGIYKGTLTIDGVDISPVQAKFFKQDDKTYLWMNRCPILEYNDKERRYTTRMSRPHWEAYLVKKTDSVYAGEFIFLRFKYLITAQWSNDNRATNPFQVLNVFVERAPLAEQTIINSIYDRRQQSKTRRDSGR